MSIRKRSATMRRREAGAISRRGTRVGAWLIGACLVLGVLAGCSEGTSKDAERGKVEDARRTSVVSDLQATHSARLILQGTPPATATSEP